MSNSTEFKEECPWRPEDNQEIPALAAEIKKLADARADKFERSKKVIFIDIFIVLLILTFNDHYSVHCTHCL
jgi:hypothetical protein